MASDAEDKQGKRSKSSPSLRDFIAQQKAKLRQKLQERHGQAQSGDGENGAPDTARRKPSAAGPAGKSADSGAGRDESPSLHAEEQPAAGSGAETKEAAAAPQGSGGEVPPEAPARDTPAESETVSGAQAGAPKPTDASNPPSPAKPAEPAEPEGSSEPEEPVEPDPAEVTQARIDAIMAARAKGASREEARAIGEKAAQAARAAMGLSVGGGGDDGAQASAGGSEAGQGASAGSGASAAGGEHPAVAAARSEAYEEAIARGASEDEARLDSEAAAHLVLDDLASEPAVSSDASAAAAGGSAQPATAASGAAGSSGARVVAAKRSWLLQCVLVINTGLLALLAAAFLGLLPTPWSAGTPQVVVAKSQDATDIQAAARDRLETPTSPTSGGVSASSAAMALADRKYARALDRYQQLLTATKDRGGDPLLGDLFRLRIAQCLLHLDRPKDARVMFYRASRSHSPVLAGMAYYHLARLDLADGLYLQARMRAYRAMAALRSLPRTSPIETECDLIIARALTEKVRRFYRSDVVVSWPKMAEVDPFQGLTAAAVRRRIHESTGGVASLGGDAVQFKPAGDSEESPRWSVRCSQVPVQDVLNQFASREKCDLEWVHVGTDSRERVVSLDIRRVSWRRFNEMVCGMSGLIARFDVGRVAIHDPHAYAVLSEQRRVLAAEAESVWRSLFLRTNDEAWTAAGRFSVALMRELGGDPADALREYQVVASRFGGTDAAPRALIRSARIRYEALRDYAGARQDVNRLMNRWPNEFGRSHEANLLLARSAMQSGLTDEALRVFRKLYHMKLSAESFKEACLGAGECYYRQGQYAEAAEKLAEYVKTATSQDTDRLSEAYLLLGRSLESLRKFPGAAVAYQNAVQWHGDKQQTIEAALGLTRAQLARKDYLSALGALQVLQGRTLSPEQEKSFLVLTSRLYRGMGMPGEAELLLADRRRLARITDPRIRAELLVELSRCCLEANNLADARKWLLEAVPRLAPGAASAEAHVLLAEVSLKMGRAKEAVPLVKDLLTATTPAPLRKRARETLLGAYVHLQDYDNAAKVLSDTIAPAQGATP